jgi:Na+/H+ antiporter NhaD/arsenite permease-like protein
MPHTATLSRPLSPQPLLFPAVFADLTRLDLTTSMAGQIALVVFCVAYLLVVLEEAIHLRKSKPVVLAAGAVWVLVAVAYASHAGTTGLDEHHLEDRVLHHIGEFGELFLFLLVAMTYISAIAAHNVFLKLNAILVSRGFGLRAVFWVTGALAFAISPIADNLTTALLMGAVVLAVGQSNKRFIALACINIVVAANAGGAFSPFGDITTLMVWAEQKIHTPKFFRLLLPALANWLIPAICMHWSVPKEKPKPLQQDAELRPGWLVVILLFLATIATAVTFHMQFHLPPFLGMTTGLGYFFVYAWLTQRRHRLRQQGEPVDVFHNIADVEWDTMLFFFGVIMCVGALQEIGYLTRIGHLLYDADTGVGAFWANVGIGVLSAIVDNVPVMFAVLGMDPPMDPTGALHTPMADYQWLLVTLTAGVGGSLLSVGSAAGVALMGTARGHYTFMSHLRWLPAIALGYAASIWVHFLLDAP